MDDEPADGPTAQDRDPAGRAEAAAEDDDLAESLAALSQLSSGRLGLESLLTG